MGSGSQVGSSRVSLALGALFLGAFVVGSAELVVVGILDQILSVVREARNEARDSANSAREIRDRVRNATGAFSSQMQDAIQEAVEDVGRELTEELDGRDEFLASGVEPFRQDLVTLLQNTESIQNALSSIAGGPADLLSLDRLIGIVEGLSGRALFPLYRVLASDSGILNSGIAQKLGLGGWRSLYEANVGVIGGDPDLIRPGQVLVVP